jgi:phospholipid transport system substrate-binding protein
MKKRCIMNPRIILVLFMIFCLHIGVPEAATASTVTDEVKRTVDDVIKIVTNAELKKPQNEQKRRQELRSTIGRIFDYREMAKRSMGVHWKTLTPAQKDEFVHLFASLLENSYAGKIESYNQEKIVYGKELTEGNYAQLDSTVIATNGDEYSLDYRLLKVGNKWMVYDVVIEGVSLISNYRTQFNNIITGQGYDALVNKLRAKSGGGGTP